MASQPIFPNASAVKELGIESHELITGLFSAQIFKRLFIL
jgi:hypothetical protein